ncbi:putative late blight resistance proteinR1A-10 [Sesamum alatum]|uniref:Late blight resistance proteinR1A-10 n=1 Tax=Sesamum alatum TaxID=300844 RepID=A0AAE1YBG3_9LAMI|nr:putative late blight resistance proteinR1A-10 [Sesamum alatum]
MAYAAVISLKQTIERLRNSSQIPFLLSFPETIKSAYEEVQSLQKILTLEDSNSKEVNSLQEFLQRNSQGLESINRERVKAAGREIREAACRLEDVLESAHVSNHFLKQSETLYGDDEISTLSQDMAAKDVKEEISFFIQTVEKIKEQLSSSLPPEKDDAAVVSSRSDHLGIKKTKIFGLDGDLIKLKDLLTGDHSNTLEIVSVVGMGGIGKTTLTKEVYLDPFIANYFECSAFVSLGPECHVIEILQGILDQISPATVKRPTKSLKRLAKYVSQGLKSRRYLIVLDDIWDTWIMDALISYFRDDENGSRIVLTTRNEEVAHCATRSNWTRQVSPPNLESQYQIVLRVRPKATRHSMLGAGKYLHKMRFLNEEESWHLLREYAFAGEELCPTQLEEAGKKIAKKCEGLPLAIIAVGKHLSTAERTLEYWTKVAETESSVIISADEEITKVLYLSYKYLPQHLRACFLYMGVFPHNYEIPTSKLIKLWCAEGFVESDSANTLENLAIEFSLKESKMAKTSENLKGVLLGNLANIYEDSKNCFKDLESNSDKTLEDFAMECLDDLVSRSLVLVRQKSSSSGHGIKTCRTHTTYWHMCVKEAGKEKFFHVINNYANGVTKGVERQRRLCIHNNVLFGIKDVHKSMASVSNARSLLCSGPHHHYPVPMCFNLRLLRVLDAVTIRFYEFPIEVLKLVQLRYLAFTYNKSLPASISKLWNLQYLIVHRQYISINPLAARSLPMEIWKMQELRHLEVMGSDLPNPSSATALLPNLLTLLGISARSCTKEVLGRIPNLKKLGIQIELALNADVPLSCLDHLSHLHGLESLKCVIMNPKLSFAQVVAPRPPPFSRFPSGLKKLTLSGLGVSWEYMSSIAQLPNLKVLKLRHYAFQGPVWRVYDSEFLQLKFLLLEDTDLEFWSAGCHCFRQLKHLIIRHCYKLKEFSGVIGHISFAKTIMLDNCSPSLASSAKQVLEKQLIFGGDPVQLIISSSEDDRKRKP